MSRTIFIQKWFQMPYQAWKRKKKKKRDVVSTIYLTIRLTISSIMLTVYAETLQRQLSVEIINMGKFSQEKRLIYRSSHPGSPMLHVDGSVECGHGEGREGKWESSTCWLVSPSTSAYKTANCLYSFINLFLEANASCINSCRIADRSERYLSTGFEVEGKLNR